jgi:hypothetical protein
LNIKKCILCKTSSFLPVAWKILQTSLKIIGLSKAENKWNSTGIALPEIANLFVMIHYECFISELQYVSISALQLVSITKKQCLYKHCFAQQSTNYITVCFPQKRKVWTIQISIREYEDSLHDKVKLFYWAQQIWTCMRQPNGQ